MKYSIGSSEGDFEPGSENKVLKNKLGITVEQDMIDAEDDLLFQLYEYVFDAGKSYEALNFQIIQNWHRLWLGNIYDWAGELRMVNMSKGGFPFTGATHIPKLIQSFEQGYLSKFSDLGNYSEEALVHFLTESHIEFILIHPFREGNGRISRLLMDVMVTQAGFEPLDYSLMEQNKEYYFKSIQAGVGEDYQPLNRLMADIFKQSNLQGSV
jgi:cell filamentation protein